MPEQLLTWLDANPELFLGFSLLTAIVLSMNGVQSLIPGVRSLNRWVSAQTLPFVGRLTLPGFLIIGSTTVYLWLENSISTVVATGIGVSIIVTAVGNRINIFADRAG